MTDIAAERLQTSTQNEDTFDHESMKKRIDAFTSEYITGFHEKLEAIITTSVKNYENRIPVDRKNAHSDTSVQGYSAGPHKKAKMTVAEEKRKESKADRARIVVGSTRRVSVLSDSD